ncbi:MAG: hypothetical protein H7125_15705 [Proteobacteria bacterium]|nr:hypothetical protein [Burkholderiales bacterium]
MAAMIEDQAASLRRLFGGSTLNSVLLAGGDAGIGQTALVANVAHALAIRGHAVLVIDAQPQLRSGARWFSLTPRGDLGDALAGTRRLDEVMLQAPSGLSWLPAAQLRHARGHTHEGMGGRGAIGPGSPARTDARGGAGPGASAERVVAELGTRFDTVLIDVPADRLAYWWPVAAHAGTVVLGSTEQQRSITAAYAALKSLAWQVGQQRYLWWIARAAGQASAEATYNKVAQTARRFLSLSLGFAGYIPADPMVGRAERLRRPLAQAFPSSPSAGACTRLAERLGTLPQDAQAADLLWQALVGIEAQTLGNAALAAAAPPLPTLRGTTDRAPDRMPIGARGRTALVSR